MAIDTPGHGDLYPTGGRTLRAALRMEQSGLTAFGAVVPTAIVGIAAVRDLSGDMYDMLVHMGIGGMARVQVSPLAEVMSQLSHNVPGSILA